MGFIIWDHRRWSSYTTFSLKLDKRMDFSLIRDFDKTKIPSFLRGTVNFSSRSHLNMAQLLNPSFTSFYHPFKAPDSLKSMGQTWNKYPSRIWILVWSRGDVFVFGEQRRRGRKRTNVTTFLWVLKPDFLACSSTVGSIFCHSRLSFLPSHPISAAIPSKRHCLVQKATPFY